jgi:hypothetical protein
MAHAISKPLIWNARLRRQARAAQFVRSRDSSFALQLYAKFGRHLLLRRTESDMEKPTARGPVPSRKAHLVLGKKIKSKNEAAAAYAGEEKSHHCASH